VAIRFRGKRPRIKKADRLEKTRQEIQFASDYRDHNGITRRWNELLDAYRGQYLDPDQREFEDEIVINYAFATANVIWPSVSIKEPTISVLPRAAENEDRAILTEALINYEWERLGAQGPFRQAVWDSIVLGQGWVKVGWEYDESSRPLSEEEQLSEIASQLTEADRMAILDPTGAEHELRSDAQIAADVGKMTTTDVVRDDPYVEHVSPFDMYVNSEATSLADARWIAHRQIRTLEEAKADKIYRPGVRSKLQSESILTQGLGYGYEDQKRYEDQIDRVVIWEFWDLDRRQMMAFSDQSEEFLIDPRPFPFEIGHPFRVLRNYTTTDRFYAQGDIEQIIPLVHELNATRSQMLNHRRKQGRKWIGYKDAFDEDSRRALESSEDNVIAWVSKSNQRPLDQIIAPLPNLPLNHDVYNIDDRLNGDINLISGISEYQRGAAPATRQTATEAAMIQDATNARQAEKLSQVEVFIAEIAGALLGIMQQFMQGHRDVRVVGRLGGDPIWFAADEEDIRGDYLFKVQAGSTQPTNESTRRTNAITAMQVLGPFVGTIVDPVQLVKHVMVEGLDIRQPEKLLTPPAMQELAQAQAALGQGQEQQQVGTDPNLQGAQGVGAPQSDPAALLAIQQQSQTVNGVPGIPDSLTDQLSNQVGLNVGA